MRCSTSPLPVPVRNVSNLLTEYCVWLIVPSCRSTVPGGAAVMASMRSRDWSMFMTLGAVMGRCWREFSPTKGNEEWNGNGLRK